MTSGSDMTWLISLQLARARALVRTGWDPRDAAEEACLLAGAFRGGAGRGGARG